MGKFGDMLKQLRNDKKISIRNMAESLEMSPTFLSDIENGRRLPPNSDKHFDSICKMAEVLDLSKDEADDLRRLADAELTEKGLIAKDVEEYMKKCPTAQVAMRKAVTNKINEDKWKEILKILEED